MPKKASAETQLRHAKTRLRSIERWAESLQREILARRRAGGMLANIAFNLAQREGVEPELREVLDETRKLWDEIPKAPTSPSVEGRA